jgi:hypothetical protein
VSEEKKIGILVRVYPDVEYLVRYVSQVLGYQPSAVRNTALLYGLILLANSKRLPNDDAEFFKMIEITKEIIKKSL